MHLLRSTHRLHCHFTVSSILSLSYYLWGSSLSLYTYFYYPLLFAPLHCLSILSIPLIPSSLSSQMRWSGPGLAIPFPSNLCPSLLLPCRLICTLHEPERLDGWYSPQHSPSAPSLSCRATLNTSSEPRWPWRQAAYACACNTGTLKIIMMYSPRSLAHVRSHFPPHQRVITGSLPKLLQALSCSYTRVHPVRGLDVSLKLDDHHQHLRCLPMCWGN